jgi:hypothetical protein
MKAVYRPIYAKVKKNIGSGKIEGLFRYCSDPAFQGIIDQGR